MEGMVCSRGEELVRSQTGEQPTAEQAICNYQMKTKSFAKTSPWTRILGIDPCMNAAKAVGGTGRCKNIPGLPVTRMWLEMALSLSFPTCKTGLQREIEPTRLDMS